MPGPLGPTEPVDSSSERITDRPPMGREHPGVEIPHPDDPVASFEGNPARLSPGREAR